jgi:K+-sensing histidine kinase KdpD
MVRFEFNRSQKKHNNFCDETLYILAQTQDEADIIGSQFQEFGFSSNLVDQEIINKKIDKKSILLISSEIHNSIVDKKILDLMVAKFYVFLVDSTDNKIGVTEFSGDGYIVLPMEQSDVLNIISHCKIKGSFENDLNSLEEYKSNLMKITSLGQYTGSLVHDLNNYNTVCMTALDGLRLINERTYKDQKIDFLVTKGLKGSRMINALSRKYRKFLYSKEDTVSDFFNIEAIVEETIEFINKEIISSQIKVTQCIPKDLFIYCNDVSLIQVLMNILSNAFHAIKDFDEKWVDISIKTSESGITLIIEDSGHGISPEVQERMFDPLFTTKPKEEGTGFGLNFCTTELNQMGMKLKYIEGENTIFGISVPTDKLRKSMII